MSQDVLCKSANACWFPLWSWCSQPILKIFLRGEWHWDKFSSSFIYTELEFRLTIIKTLDTFPQWDGISDSFERQDFIFPHCSDKIIWWKQCMLAHSSRYSILSEGQGGRSWKRLVTLYLQLGNREAWIQAMVQLVPFLHLWNPESSAQEMMVPTIKMGLPMLNNEIKIIPNSQAQLTLTIRLPEAFLGLWSLRLKSQKCTYAK